MGSGSPAEPLALTRAVIRDLVMLLPDFSA